MTTADDLLNQSFSNVRRLGLREIPFTESPIDLQGETLRRVFTGRETELRQVFNLFQSRDRRRIFVYGRIGIGKSAFLLEVLSALRRSPQFQDMLITYISMPPEPADLDLATMALIAVARGMEDDDWAQHQLYQMGIPTAKVLKERSAEVGGKVFSIGGKVSEKDLPITKPQYPTLSLETLLERAQEKYRRGVVVAIDDLDKRDPWQVQKLLHDAQGMLKGRAWFFLTGHPKHRAGDLLTAGRGLFDLELELTELDEKTTYKMLVNYLNSARIDNDCNDPDDPRSVLPFLPETAELFCKQSRGHPRLFNRLGHTVLSMAADLEVETIAPALLMRGLHAAAPKFRDRAALSVQEEKVRAFLQQQGRVSDETITLEDLQSLGFQSFNQALPILERLAEEDLAYQIDRGDAIAFEPTLSLPPADESAP